ncbi:Protein of unknown function DUF781 containing protein, partial [Cricetulus griseus]
YAYYSEQEENFEQNWAIAVNYIAAAYFPTTLNRTNSFQKGLPPRVLYDTDIPPFIANFTSLQNKVLLSLTALGDIDELTGIETKAQGVTLYNAEFERHKAKRDFHEDC